MRRSHTPSQHWKVPFISCVCPPPNPNITLRPLHLPPSPIKSCCFSNVIASFHAPMWGNYAKSPDCIFISEGEKVWLHKAMWYLYFSGWTIFSCLNLILLKFTVENSGPDKSNSFEHKLWTHFSACIENWVWFVLGPHSHIPLCQTFWVKSEAACDALASQQH